MNEQTRPKQPGKAIRCPQCGAARVHTEHVDEPFTYGEGPGAVQLSALVPLRRCARCGMKFLDAAAEDAQHEAICRHLGVMTPAEILALRRRHGLSRAQFAQLTKLGAATLARWERGVLIQNAAYDQLLYLLTFDENVERLRRRGESERAPIGRASARGRGGAAARWGSD
jgi:putative zinc finger/helix-turn-helix YgiT family protein